MRSFSETCCDEKLELLDVERPVELEGKRVDVVMVRAS